LFVQEITSKCHGKEINALWTIVTATSISSLQASVPVPGFESHKHVVMTSVEITMCLTTAKIYFGDRITKVDLTPIFQEAGIAFGVGGGLGLVATKVGHVTTDELLNFCRPTWLGPEGWACW
jgi:hypothetical protein